MSDRPISSLARKSSLFFLVISFLAISLMGLIWHRYSLKSQHEFIEKSLTDETRLIGMAMRPALSFRDRQYALRTLAGMQQHGRFDTIQIFDHQHHLLTAIGQYAAEPLQQQLQGNKTIVLHRDHALVVIQPISLGDELLGHIVTVTDETTLARHLKQNYPVILSGMAVTFLITVLLALVANRRYEKISRRNEMLLQELGEKNRALQQAKDEADTANAAKDIFLANVSHEVRTPLNGILGMNQLLEQSGLSESQQEFSNSIRNSARHLLTIVEQLLDLSVVESDRDEARNEQFSPSEVVADVIRSKQLQAKQKGLQLSCHMDTSIPAVIESDATRLRQVLSNVLDNAIKYTAEGFVKLQVRREPGHLLLQVSDSGPGIDIADQQHIFDNFFRGNHDDSNPTSGIGLGLAICKKLLRKIGGDIRLESRPGEGSTFYIRFPFSTCSSDNPQLPDWIRYITILSEDAWLATEIENYIRILDSANAVPVSRQLDKADLAHTLLLIDSRFPAVPEHAGEVAQIRLQ
jgi:signal transduction histidine kinase